MNEEEKKRIIQGYVTLFSYPEAGIVLPDLAEITEFFKPSFRNSNPEGTAYGEGKRSVMLRILQFSGYEYQIRKLLERN